jgi:hypothetical protein
LEDIKTHQALPVQGDPNEDDPEETTEKVTKDPEKHKKQKGPNMFSRLKTRFMRAIEYGPDDENDPEIE